MFESERSPNNHNGEQITHPADAFIEAISEKFAALPEAGESRVSLLLTGEKAFPEAHDTTSVRVAHDKEIDELNLYVDRGNAPQNRRIERFTADQATGSIVRRVITESQHNRFASESLSTAAGEPISFDRAERIAEWLAEASVVADTQS
jgi:hypothetical protein